MDDPYDDHVAAPLLAGIALVERSLAYTLGSLQLVTPAALERATPCHGWTLRRLLAHLTDSLSALHEAATLGEIGPPVDRSSPVDPLADVRQAACGVVGAWANLGRGATVAVGDCAMTAAVVAGVGAVEVAVHGWDVARSCGGAQPMPASLAEELLDLAMLFVTDADRLGRFAAPVKAPPGAPAQDRLLSFLGRHPEWHAG